MIVRARAPLRLSFAGGGTDIAAFSDVHGGAVLCASLNLFAIASFSPRPSGPLVLRSDDYQLVEEHPAGRPLSLDGNLQIAKCAMNELGGLGPGEMTLGVDAPPGSGLGASSALAVAVIGLMRELRSLPLSDREVANTAIEVERVKLEMPGGQQDQYAATFGGFNFIEFRSGQVAVTPLLTRKETLLELEASLVLCFTPRCLDSSIVLETHLENIRAGATTSVAAMLEAREIAGRMREALEIGDLAEFGRLLHRGWQAKQQFAHNVSTPFLDDLYDVGRSTGALGGKLCGAGGGGYMCFFVPWEKKQKVSSALRDAGVEVASVGFSEKGLTSWSTHAYPAS